jgi:tetratricopeptide (TPR) repeat protein
MLPVLSMAAVSPAAVRVYAKVETETAIYPGDQFVYSVVVEGGSPSSIDISPLAPFNPQNTGHTSYTINRLTMISQNYALTAGKAGPLRLPSVTVVVDGQTYTTNPVDVTVSAPGTTDQMTLEFSLSEKQCYVGQPLVMTVKWVVIGRAEGGAFNVPVFQSGDFYIEDMPEPANAQSAQRISLHGVPVTIVGGRQLIRGVEADGLSFSKILIPKKAGHLRLDPITATANLAVGRERTSDFFNPYRLRFQRVSVQSDAVELDAQPLPETGKPPQFYGLVGRYTITASAAPTKVNVGDPITLTIRIGGSPYLKPVQWPALEQVPELAANFKIPTEKASPVLEGGEGSGPQVQNSALGSPSPTRNSALGGPAKVFTQTIRANSDKVTQVPAIPLAYFDPARGSYVVAKTEPIKLQVAPTKVLTNVDVQGTTASGPVNREVEAIRQGLSANYYGPEVLENQSFSILSVATNPLYAALWSVPLMALIVSAVVKLAGRTSPESLARKRRRRAAGVALAQLKRVSGAEPGQRHELLLSAMKGYLGERFDKVAASLTADDCHRIITDSTGDAVTAVRYKELIDTCEAARYARVEGVPPSERGQDARDTIGPDQVQAAVALIQSLEGQGRRGRKTGDGGRKSSPSSLFRRSSFGLLLVVLSWLPGQAAKAAPALPRDQLYALLQEANTAFQTANAANNPDIAMPLYDKAILLYEKIIDQGGVRNARLYYNLANAYLLREDLGRAILNYRRAEKLDASDLNIKKNLSFARSRRADRVETSTQRRVLETLFFWHYDFSLKTKALLACLFLGIFCAVLALIVWLGRGSAIFVAAVLSGVLFLCLLTSLLLRARQEAGTRCGVITAAEVVARQGDGPNYPPSFKDSLHAGLEFTLVEHRPGWLHIELADGSDAWIPDDTAGLV